MSNDVFFLGAGFSKAIDNCYPTLKILTQKVTENYMFEKHSVAMHLQEEVPTCYKKDLICRVGKETCPPEIYYTFLPIS